MNAKERLATILANRRKGADSGHAEPSTVNSRQVATGADIEGTNPTSIVSNGIQESSEHIATALQQPPDDIPVHAGNTGQEVKIQITPNTPVSGKLLELQTALELALPELPMILKSIHTTLRGDPDTVRVLSEEEIGLIVKGLISHTHATIVAAPKKSSSKKTQPVSLDMLD